MARTKQPAIKREASSEFFNKTTATWEDTNGSGKGHKMANGHPATAKTDAAHEKAEAGVVQLVVAVAGIYASL